MLHLWLQSTRPRYGLLSLYELHDSNRPLRNMIQGSSGGKVNCKVTLQAKIMEAFKISVHVKIIFV